MQLADLKTEVPIALRHGFSTVLPIFEISIKHFAYSL
jgi:hypothetical protein